MLPRSREDAGAGGSVRAKLDAVWTCPESTLGRKPVSGVRSSGTLRHPIESATLGPAALKQAGEPRKKWDLGKDRGFNGPTLPIFPVRPKVPSGCRKASVPVLT